MDAREVLSKISTFLDLALSGPLTHSEILELRWLCENMPEMPDRAEFNEAFQQFRLMLDSSGALDFGGKAREPDQLLKHLRGLRKIAG